MKNLMKKLISSICFLMIIQCFYAVELSAEISDKCAQTTHTLHYPVGINTTNYFQNVKDVDSMINRFIMEDGSTWEVIPDDINSLKAFALWQNGDWVGVFPMNHKNDGDQIFSFCNRSKSPDKEVRAKLYNAQGSQATSPHYQTVQNIRTLPVGGLTPEVIELSNGSTWVIDDCFMDPTLWEVGDRIMVDFITNYRWTQNVIVVEEQAVLINFEKQTWATAMPYSENVIPS